MGYNQTIDISKVESLLDELGSELSQLKEKHSFDQVAEAIRKSKGSNFNEGGDLDVLEHVAHISKPMIEYNRLRVSSAMMYMNNKALYFLFDLGKAGDRLYQMVKHAEPGSVDSKELFELCQAVGTDCRSLREMAEAELCERVDYLSHDLKEQKEKMKLKKAV